MKNRTAHSDDLGLTVLYFWTATILLISVVIHDTYHIFNTRQISVNILYSSIKAEAVCTHGSVRCS